MKSAHTTGRVVQVTDPERRFLCAKGEHISAKTVNGVLEVRIPKSEKALPRRIKVQTLSAFKLIRVIPCGGEDETVAAQAGGERVCLPVTLQGGATAPRASTIKTSLSRLRSRRLRTQACRARLTVLVEEMHTVAQQADTPRSAMRGDLGQLRFLRFG